MKFHTDGLSLAWLTPDLISIYIDEVWEPHIHFLVLEAGFMIARSRLLGAWNVLSYDKPIISIIPDDECRAKEI